MVKFNPYLRFNGNCKEAMTFYKECLGGELDLQMVGESPMATQMPPESHNNVLHSTLKTGDITIMAADGMMGQMTKGNMIALCLSGGKDSIPEIKSLAEKLSAGGKVTYPIKEEFFGLYGEVEDKFGITWLFQADTK